MRNIKSILITIASLVTLMTPTFASTAQAVVVADPSSPSQLVFYRMYNQKINDHFYTTSYAETVSAEKSGYILEGVLGYLESSQQNGTKSVIRMWDPKGQKHFYTTDNSEAQYVQQHAGFVLEGIMGYIQVDTPPSTTTNGDAANPALRVRPEYTLYRLYNFSQNKHFYTTSTYEMQTLLNSGYRLEGDLGTLFSPTPCTEVCPL